MEQPHPQFAEARRAATTISLGIAALLGIALEVVWSYQFVTGFAILARYGIIPPVPEEYQTSLFLFTAFPFAYCFLFSLLVRPKQILTPLTILLGATTTDMIIVADYVIRTPSNNFYSAIPTGGIVTEFILIEFLLLSLAIIIGTAETVVLGWIIGLDSELLDRKSYTINLPPKVVWEALRDADSIYLRRLRKMEVDEKVIVLRRRFTTGETILLALTRDPNSNEKTMLATVAYVRSLYGLTSTPLASSTRDSIVGDLLTRLRQKNPETNLSDRSDLSDYASFRAYAVSQAPTRSKLS